MTTKFRSGVFISYSHVDRAWLKRLQTHLAPYIRGEKLEVWDDTRIPPGANWAAEIEAALNEARVAVLLVSPDFLASSYVATVELPAIVRRASDELTIIWIPIRPSAYDTTVLRDYQAAVDPSHPLSTLPKPKQEAALVEIAKRIARAIDVNMIANSLRIIDNFQPEVAAFVAGAPEPTGPVAHAVRAQQVQDTINLVDAGGERRLITAADLGRLDSDAQKLIRAYERTMKDLYERWTELKPKRYAQDPVVRDEARRDSDDIRKDLCSQLRGLLSFIESMGMTLQDHYAHVRFICSQG